MQHFGGQSKGWEYKVCLSYRLACWGPAGWCHDTWPRAVFCFPSSRSLHLAPAGQMYRRSMTDGLLRDSWTSSAHPEETRCLCPCVQLAPVGVVQSVAGGPWAEWSQALLCRLGWSRLGSGGQGRGMPVSLDCNCIRLCNSECIISMRKT